MLKHRTILGESPRTLAKIFFIFFDKYSIPTKVSSASTQPYLGKFRISEIQDILNIDFIVAVSNRLPRLLLLAM